MHALLFLQKRVFIAFLFLECFLYFLVVKMSNYTEPAKPLHKMTFK